MELRFPTDTDGYLSQECPSCDQRFKVRFGEGSDAPISFCPYCGHKGDNCWYTSPQVEHLRAVATSTMLGPQLKKFERKLKGSSGGLLQLKMQSNLPDPGEPPMETEDDLLLVRFPCCEETVKLNKHDRHFCIICGNEIDMNESNSKRVFLSHKGIDKEEVKDYKETLKLLGFDPWIDEDAMPAGTPLERGLLKGMQDSCGVVFFITPSFQDEGYLETEINYAIAEKRKKGERFAIIALQFIDDKGNSGEIPELLQSYVWKQPTTLLQALREILRALPIESKAVDWRDNIDGVVTMPSVKSTTSDLSPEAKAILLAAVKGDGHVTCFKDLRSGPEISTNGKSLMPDRENRTAALWLGGIEDLQRRRLIKDAGHKGEVFNVTREGYEMADELTAGQ